MEEKEEVRKKRKIVKRGKEGGGRQFIHCPFNLLDGHSCVIRVRATALDRRITDAFIPLSNIQPAFLQVVYARVDRDAFDPGTYGRISAIALDLGKHIDKCVLQQIFGISLVSHHAQTDIVHSPRIRGVQLLLRPAISALACRNQSVVLRIVFQEVWRFTLGMTSFSQVGCMSVKKNSGVRLGSFLFIRFTLLAQFLVVDIVIEKLIDPVDVKSRFDLPKWIDPDTESLEIFVQMSLFLLFLVVTHYWKVRQKLQDLHSTFAMPRLSQEP